MNLFKRLGVANTVTVVRIMFIPVFLGVMLVDWPSLFPGPHGALYELRTWLAALMFVLLAATDAIDGYLARSRNEVTTFGKFIDPLADKILVTAALVALIQTGVLPAWIALVIITREFVVSGLRMLASAEGIVIAASWYGKVKTNLQIVAVVMFILKDSDWAASMPAPMPAVIAGGAWVVMAGAVIMTILSMVDYFAGASHVLVGPWHGSAEHGGETSASVQAGLATELVDTLETRGLTVAVAESITGGLVASSIIEIPGASHVLPGGVVVYSDDAKVDVLGVDPSVIARDSATSGSVALLMATAVREKFGADFGVSTTGNAGPSQQGSAPIGTYFVAVASAEDSFVARYDVGALERDEVRARAVNDALSAAKTAAIG